MRDDGPTVREITTAVHVIPADAPEADGTLAWDKTTMVLTSIRAGAAKGIGWTYAAAAAQGVITDVLAGAITGRSALDVAGAAEAMARAVRNIRPGTPLVCCRASRACTCCTCRSITYRQVSLRPSPPGRWLPRWWAGGTCGPGSLRPCGCCGASTPVRSTIMRPTRSPGSSW
jgi:hypothetical protein